MARRSDGKPSNEYPKDTIPAGYITSQESHDRDTDRIERKERQSKREHAERESAKLLARKEREERLAFLRSLVERGLIRLSTMEHIAQNETLDTQEIREIFAKIDEIEEVKDIDSILPVHLRVKKDEYLAALDDPTIRQNLLVHIDQALTFLFQSSHPMSLSGISLFTGFLYLLGSQRDAYITVQESMIDIKRSLKKHDM